MNANNPYDLPEGEGYGMPPTSPLTYDKATGLGQTETTTGDMRKVSPGGFEIPTIEKPVREPAPPSRAPQPVAAPIPVAEGPYTILGLPWYYWVGIAAAGYFTYRYFFAGEEKKPRGRKREAEEGDEE